MTTLARPAERILEGSGGRRWKVRAAPDRMLWASNWPQPNPPPGSNPDSAVLLDMLLDWAPDDATRHKILVDNPARLYGFA